MRAILLSFPIIVAAGAGWGQEGMPNSLQMSCAEASALVRERSQVVIASGPNVYQRVISEPGACFAEQDAVPAWVPTADQGQCLVGYRCQERIGNDK